MSTHHKLHPLCSIFPPMSDEEFERLRDDIAKHGQRTPILLYDGQILDGRHRHDACLLLKIQPKFETFTGTFDEAESLVLSLNLARRHLDSSQRMNIAARLATLERGRPKNAQICALTLTQQEAAKKLNVSTRGVQAAKYVNEHAAPEVIAEVDAGRMSIHKAQKLIAALPDKNRQALAVKADAVDEMIAAHAAELQAAAKREAAAEPKPAWLADPDDLDRPEETDLPPLPKTSTHHTAANHREPDARETDRQGLVTIDDPRDYVDGAWYRFDESMGRLFWVTDDAVLERAKEIGQARGLWLVFSEPVINTEAPTTDSRDTKKVVERERDTKPGKVPTGKALCSFVEERADIGTNRHLWSEQMVKGVQEWALYKQSLTGKAKVRSLEQWAKALTRIENVVAAQGWPAVADMLEKAIANGWQGWEHQTDNGRKSAPVAPHRTYTRLNKPEIKYDELPE